MRGRILNRIDEMLSACIGIGKNPFVVNVVTFSGHSILADGDTIFVVPESEVGGDHKTARFINVSGLARKFAERNNTLSVFIMNTSSILPQFNIYDQGSSDVSMETTE